MMPPQDGQRRVAAGSSRCSFSTTVFILTILPHAAICSANDSESGEVLFGDDRRRQQETSLCDCLLPDGKISFAYTASDFTRALANPLMDGICLASPVIDVDADAWTASGAELPFVRTRNITFCSDSRLSEWPILQLNSGVVVDKMRLADGVALTVTGIIIKDYRSDNPTRAPGLDILLPTAEGETAVLIFITTVAIIPACFPLGFRQDDGAGLSPPSKYPAKLNVTWSLPQDGCVNSTSAPMLKRCWGDKGRIDELAAAGADFVTVGGSLVPNNMDILMINMTAVCAKMLDRECLDQYGAVTCFLLAIRQPASPSANGTGAVVVASAQEAAARSPAPRSSSGPSRDSIIAVVVGSIAGAAVVALIVAALVVLRSRRRGSKNASQQYAPSAVPAPLIKTSNILAEGDDRQPDRSPGDALIPMPFDSGGVPGGGGRRPKPSQRAAPPSAATRVVRLDVPVTPLTPTREDFSLGVHLMDAGSAATNLHSFARSDTVSLLVSVNMLLTPPFEQHQVPPACGGSVATGIDSKETRTGVLSPGSGTTDGAVDTPSDSEVTMEGDGSSITSGVVQLLDTVCGKGAYGRVVEGMYGGQKVAVKLMANLQGLGGQPRDHFIKSFKQEVEILGRCQHPNIVRLLAACLEPPRLFLVMELMETSLDRAMYRNPAGPLMPLAKVLYIGTAIANALAYLHPTIVHRDLKPANVLVSEPWSDRPVVKLTDFGLSRLRVTVVPTENPDAGTPAYMAPECFDISNNYITHKADIYSLGVLLWEMLAACRPWAGMNPLEVAITVTYRRECLSPDRLDASRCSLKMWRLLLSCWDSDPARRPAAAEVAKELTLVLQQLQEPQQGGTRS